MHCPLQTIPLNPSYAILFYVLHSNAPSAVIDVGSSLAFVWNFHTYRGFECHRNERVYMMRMRCVYRDICSRSISLWRRFNLVHWAQYLNCTTPHATLQPAANILHDKRFRLMYLNEKKKLFQLRWNLAAPHVQPFHESYLSWFPITSATARSAIAEQPHFSLVHIAPSIVLMPARTTFTYTHAHLAALRWSPESDTHPVVRGQSCGCRDYYAIGKYGLPTKDTDSGAGKTTTKICR